MKEFSYPTLEPFNFLGLNEQDYEKAKVAIFPVPYNSTTYWKSGTKDGPQAMIEASRHIELYDMETKKDASKQGIFTLELLEPSKNSPEETIARIKNVVDQLLQDGKFPMMLGGEHSITLGAVQAFKEKFDDFSVLQIDAHSDLREEFEGTKFHHACVMKRIKDLGLPITQVGIRSMPEGEEAEHIFLAPEIPVDRIIATLKENVYLTFDLDGLDTSIMPSTGTPEPGGLGWYEVLNLIKEVAEKRKIIGADVVELDPIPGLTAPDFLAAKLVYKIINYIIK
ncbi:MAG: agmatinase [Candidatus Nealsonbacteria bacterium RIFCSPLOWO2_01_FULL_43_32]|uniref:Agmatinase n=1 Tax=Candidatus Nealsonbacteria bacterium RIFCSPLOWO2_01_FULL_43_32 TaxID=1801672 RepID=A0A1G2EDU0_9BACT|nr:MAG: agmatinase [Candidatus Nealsonbacteria bacterium RIFCSPLOWO2_01_FULL_43_32]